MDRAVEPGAAPSRPIAPEASPEAFAAASGALAAANGALAASDEALMARYRDGDAGAFDELYARHRSVLYRFILRQCAHRGEADEIFQDVWMNLINARSRYQPSARFRTFLFQIARNRVIDIARRSHAAVERSFDDEAGVSLAQRLPADAGCEPQAIAEQRDRAQAVRAAIAALPFPQREALLLHEEGELSLEEIAALTGANRETVKSRLRYALARLRAQFAGLGEDLLQRQRTTVDGGRR